MRLKMCRQYAPLDKRISVIRVIQVLIRRPSQQCVRAAVRITVTVFTSLGHLVETRAVIELPAGLLIPFIGGFDARRRAAP